MTEKDIHTKLFEQREEKYKDVSWIDYLLYVEPYLSKEEKKLKK
ncbi:MAG: hypothetical protein Q7S22_04675 [Candidatus Micrarchaeota archaeon]|nr:hypothetical protein [Candidatus Micrarchaeota archaeon]